MRYFKNQAGFSAIEIIAVVAIVGLIGFVGYKALTNAQLASRTSTESAASAETVAPAPQIKSRSDLNAAATSLDQIDVEAGANDAATLSDDLSRL